MVETRIKRIDPKDIDQDIIEEFAKMLAEGKTVIFPTETVYGLGANALDEKAAQKIYEAKGRPSDNPLLVHVCDKEDVYDLVEYVDDKAKILIDKFWPGPLTIVFKKKPIIPDRTSGGLDTVAIRMPSDEIARRLIRSAGVPIAAPSANISGRPSPTRPDHIIRDMTGRVDGILAGDPCTYGVESTIVDLSGDYPVVLRPGSVTLEMIAGVLGDARLDPSILNKDDNIKAKAPGMKYTHYSPRAEVYIVDLKGDDFVDKIKELVGQNADMGKKTGLMCMDIDMDRFDGVDIEIFSLGQTEEIAAKRLFDGLIDLDKRGVDVIYSVAFEEKNVGVAIMNRLKKSAGYRIIK
ncbi:MULTISPECIES: L-threonylcarbamoyladenylate synthase [Peptostreptococcus]|mgnify:FL=1|uniref:L-threonylcarbamoyladenylate synthase n=1 Tax=Peptostreptococcus TaxID=1257 RepID=UPI000767037E|nr:MULTISPECIES: L-threonylcarbamoyladenylate synthase [Peptostreptococcus]KXB68964.1 Sua5/YciO/YrdC/YwlC family protein [Peptostreptococcus anaerobius]MCB6983401.1 threonylcarbamoyl-AMP synthase [Peptostreptococcus anaerobius]MCQ5151238.1 L-threonylcarbamoyladenylate synthase [Peptostreptococcus anaerobius]MDU0964888.1 L-threonylcarbamoyladenylate synthase [Peptostreptococcus anaerobius]MDU0998635.1 L-threonylcarbamoyladenylate synthase [Peptostreptococcus anaerobius]